ncbi:MAG: ribonuclease H-like YkuK family protein [bacterium]|nr:ribonuclease H-like YkuK family protein [bacterium]
MTPTEQLKTKTTLVAAPSIEAYLFMTGRGEKITPLGVVSEILSFMQIAPNCNYKITIGTDSECLNDKRADFVTAIVIHRVGNGGKYFWRRIVDGKKFFTLRDRMIREAMISLEIAHAFLAETEKIPLPKFDFEIHVDVGENGATRTMLQELTGIIRANNFAVKTKPDSYAASKVADRHGAKND